MGIHWLSFTTMKDVWLRMRIERDLGEQFLKVCWDEHEPAAQVLKEYLRHYVAEHKGSVLMTPVPEKNDAADY